MNYGSYSIYQNNIHKWQTPIVWNKMFAPLFHPSKGLLISGFNFLKCLDCYNLFSFMSAPIDYKTKSQHKMHKSHQHFLKLIFTRVNIWSFLKKYKMLWSYSLSVSFEVQVLLIFLDATVLETCALPPFALVFPPLFFSSFLRE